VPTDWRTSGVRVVRGDELDINTPQTPGMTSAAAITTARTGAEKLWAGTVIIEARCQDRPAPSRSGRKRHLCRVRPRPDALG
jgi:uncharacterized RmlC-like cupin family protein